MILEELRITKRPSWESKKLEYKGAIKYENAHGHIELHLNHETSLKVLAVVADAMVASSKELAAQLTRDVIDAIPALPAPDAKAEV